MEAAHCILVTLVIKSQNEKKGVTKSWIVRTLTNYQCWSIEERSHLGYVHTAFFGCGMDVDSASITVPWNLLWNRNSAGRY